MAKLFISHSSKNRELLDDFLEFLQLGMGVERNDIFYTSAAGDLATGETFMETIRQQLWDSEAVISIITEEYLKSKFCMAEMGAAWAMSKRYFPIILVPVERLKCTPLCGLQLRRMNSHGDLAAVYDELLECGISRKRRTAEFTRHLPGFIRRVNMLMPDIIRVEKWYRVPEKVGMTEEK